MNEPIPPLLVIPSLELSQDGKNSVTAKGFVSSLLRSLFSGGIVTFRNQELPLFKVERKAVDEVYVPNALAEKSATSRQRAMWEFLFGLGSYLKPEPRQWVIVADVASIALRNIDHLLPPDLAGPYGPPEVDSIGHGRGRARSASGQQRRGCGRCGVSTYRWYWNSGRRRGAGRN